MLQLDLFEPNLLNNILRELHEIKVRQEKERKSFFSRITQMQKEIQFIKKNKNPLENI